MKHLLSTAGLALVLAAASVSCDKFRPPQPQLEKPPPASGQVNQQEGERKAFAQAAEKELDELRAAITGFKARAEAAGVESKARMLEEVQKLEAGLSEAQKHLGTLKEATVESWTQMKESFSSSMQRLKGAVEKTRKNAT